MKSKAVRRPSETETLMSDCAKIVGAETPIQLLWLADEFGLKALYMSSIRSTSAFWYLDIEADLRTSAYRQLSRMLAR